MPVGSVSAKRFGLRQSSAAFPTSALAKAPEDWRTPRRFAPAVAHPIFIVRGATGRGMLSDQKIVLALALALLLVLVLDQFSSFVAARARRSPTPKAKKHPALSNGLTARQHRGKILAAPA